MWTRVVRRELYPKKNKWHAAVCCSCDGWDQTLNCRLRRFNLLGTLLIFAAICPQGRALTWFAEGPDGGSVRAFGSDPTDHQHLYLGTATGWIFQSHDGGKNWSRLARLANRDDLIVKKILVDSTDPKHMVVGAYALGEHPDGGVFVSNDGGAVWTNEQEMEGQSIRSLTVAPSDPKTFMAGTLEGVFRSTDGGTHWERISPKDNVEIHEVESLAVDPLDPNIIYAGTWHLPWKTRDGGKTWAIIKQGIIEDSDVFSIVVDPKQPSEVYLSACSGIYKSDDGGAKFDKVQGIPSTARRTRVLLQDPGNLNTVFAGTTEGLYRTFDAGKIWLQTTRADVIVNDVYVDPANSKHVLLATDRRGVLASDDGADSFLPSNRGFSARQITAYGADTEHAATVYVGVVNDKDSGGVFVSHTGGLSWSHLSDGLDAHDVLSLGQAADGTMLAGTEHGIYLLKDANWRRVGGDDTKIAAPPAVPATIARTKTARKPTSKSAAKQRPVARPHVAGANAVTVSFDGSVYGFARVGKALIAATSHGVLRSTTNGAAWTAVQSLAAQEWRFVASSKAAVVVASLSAVRISMDAGGTWKTVALPPSVSQVLALSMDGDGEVWVGDRDGVYVSGDDGATWQAPVNMVVRTVNSIFYDEQAGRMLVTARDPATVAYAVEVKGKQATAWDTGWSLRFVRPVGDHLIAATLFDGMVVQPRMVDSAESASH
jgi:photosystem II stability/assembly factor-like uncharacterized protein